MPSKTVNSNSTIELFDKILENNPNEGNLYLVCDNARYFKSYLIQDTIKNWASDNFHIKFRNLIDKKIVASGFQLNYFGNK